MHTYETGDIYGDVMMTLKDFMTLLFSDSDLGLEDSNNYILCYREFIILCIFIFFFQIFLGGLLFFS